MLLQAGMALASGLALATVLQRIVELAVELTRRAEAAAYLARHRRLPGS